MARSPSATGMALEGDITGAECVSFSPTCHGIEPSKPSDVTRHSPPENQSRKKQLDTFKVPENSFAGRTGASCAVPGDNRHLGHRAEASWLVPMLHFYFQGSSRSHSQTQKVTSSSHTKEAEGEQATEWEQGLGVVRT